MSIYMSSFFRPPFIIGRLQDSDSVFGRKKGISPVFEVKAPVFFICLIFKKGLPGGDRGRPGETREDWGRPGERWAIVGPPLAHRWA